MNVISMAKSKITKTLNEKICELEKENEQLKNTLAQEKYNTEFNTIHYISTDRICSDIQRDISKDDDFLNLIESIKTHGIIEPVILKRISVESSIENGLYTLISGFRRISAARILGIGKVPAIISDKSEDIVILAYNLNKNSKKYDIFEESDLVMNFLNGNKDNMEQIIESLSINKEQLAEYLLISNIPDEQREMCRQYDLSDKQMRYIAKIKDNNQRRFAIRHIGSSDMSLRQTLEYLYDLQGIDCFANSGLPSKPKMILKDIRLFYNTIDRAIDTFSESGIRTDCRKKETSEGFNINIFIHKNLSNEDK